MPQPTCLKQKQGGRVYIGCHTSCVNLEKECEVVRSVVRLKVTLTFNRRQWLNSLKQFVKHDIPELSWARGHRTSCGNL